MSAISTRPSASVDLTDGVSEATLLHIPPSIFTLQGFRNWVSADRFPENVRVAFLNGEVYLDMSKEELEYHAAVKAEICRVLMNLVRTESLGRFYLDGVLVTNEAANVANNPDATYCSWKSLEAGRVQLSPRTGVRGQYIELAGAPDWVLEVVSDSSVQKDTRDLRSSYHRCGIPEYWLVDARGENIIFQILQWRKNAYAAAPKRTGWQRSPLFDRRFRLVRAKTRLGLWEYTLEVHQK